jgi:hypothetical protein
MPQLSCVIGEFSQRLSFSGCALIQIRLASTACEKYFGSFLARRVNYEYKLTVRCKGR